MNQAEAKRRQAEVCSDLLLLAAVYILGRQIGDKGITYVAVAAEVCALLWCLVSGGLSDGLGKLLRGRKNKGQYRNLFRMRGGAMALHTALGLCGSLAVFGLAGVMSERVFRIPYSRLLLLAFAPAVLLRTVSEVLLGYLRGESAEFPGAVSGVLRQVFLLGFGILFCHMLGGYGKNVAKLLRQENFAAMYGGLGIALAVSLTELFVILFLLMVYRSSRRSEKRGRQEGYAAESVGSCVRAVCVARWPQLFTGFFLFLPFALGLFFCARVAQDGELLALDYGLYAGSYLVVCGAGLSLAVLLTLPTIAKVFACLKREENRSAKSAFQSGVHICFAHGLFLSVFATVMAPQIAGLLCPENAQKVSGMLRGGSFVIVFAALSCYFCRFLHAAGRKSHVLMAACVENLLFLIIVLPGVGRLGVRSLVYGGLAGLFMLCILSGTFSYRQMRAQMDWMGTLIVPSVAGGVAGMVCLLVGKMLAPHLGGIVTLLVAFAAAGTVYWVMLLLLRNFREQELEHISGGRLIRALGQTLNVYGTRSR